MGSRRRVFYSLWISTYQLYHVRADRQQEQWDSDTSIHHIDGRGNHQWGQDDNNSDETTDGDRSTSDDAPHEYPGGGTDEYDERR